MTFTRVSVTVAAFVHMCACAEAHPRNVRDFCTSNNLRNVYTYCIIQTGIHCASHVALTHQIHSIVILVCFDQYHWGRKILSNAQVIREKNTDGHKNNLTFIVRIR